MTISRTTGQPLGNIHTLGDYMGYKVKGKWHAEHLINQEKELVEYRDTPDHPFFPIYPIKISPEIMKPIRYETKQMETI